MIQTSTLATLIFVLTIVINVIIAAFVYANNTKHTTNRLFFALTLTISVWLTALLATRLPQLYPWNLLLARSTLVLATAMDTLFLLFSATVPEAALGVSRRRLRILLAAGAVVIAVAVSPLTFPGINVVGGVPATITGPGLGVFGIFQILLCFGAMGVLFQRVRRKSREQRLQLLLVLTGFILMFGMVFGTIFIPVLFLGDSTFVTFAPLYVLLFTGLTGYAIFNRGLLDIKVVAAEIFSAVLLFINALQLFLSGSVLDFSLRFVTFLVVGVFAVLFIRGIRAEVSRREEIQKLAAELEKSNETLRELDELKTMMVSIASHQLRGPLGGIRGYLSMFKDGDLGPLTPKQKEIVALNLNVLSRLINAVEMFLDISKLQSGKMLFQPDTVDIDELIVGISQEFEVPMQQRALAFSYVCQAPKPVKVTVDPEKLKHVIFNLVDNALKYTEHGSVTVTLQVQGPEAVIEVRDTGMGIPADDIPRLFGKFARGRLVVDRGGSGLGLYVVKMLTELQGGRVWVTSPGVQKGTSFFVALPLAKAS